jgi:gamma-glutamylcysteine synthetase
MSASRLAREVQDVVDTDLESFGEEVRREGRALKEALADGIFDNPQAIVGLEYEFYGVADDDATLRRVPRNLLDLIGFEKELGLHNAELSTSPQPLNSWGLATQENEIKARVDAAMAASTRVEGIQLVSDGLWTVPPAGESATSYVTETVEDDGVRLSTNMSESPRYHAMANTFYDPQATVDVPGVTLSTDTVAPEGLITSIQPHYQIPTADDLPAYFRYALRVAGPLLALGVNSPFFPPDLYDAGTEPDAILEDGWAENRIAVFEGVMNPASGEPKVRFPADLPSTEAAVDRIVEDRPAVPAAVSDAGRFDDEFAHIRHKHGTYWRWVRPVFEGATRSAANVRVEFRPLPGQPTIRDSVAFQAAFAGLLQKLVAADHPLRELDWETARENFYAATRDGLDADLTWITADGTRTTNHEELYADLFEQAAEGLERRGLSNDEAATYLRPLRQRADRGLTPARWKRQRVREHLADGDPFEAAIREMQREYVARQRETLVDGDFASWPRV